MKKIISLVLMIAMLFGMSAFAVEEEFTLHNGTKFGMTKAEVIEIETPKGFSFKEEPYESYVILYGKGTIANHPDSTIYYYISNDNGVYEMKYAFSTADTYATVEESLIQKYGETEYSSETGFEFPAFIEGNGDWRRPFASWTSNGGTQYNREEYSHRLIYTADEQALFIEHYTEVSKYSSKQVVRYRLLTPEELELLQLDNGTISDDL